MPSACFGFYGCESENPRIVRNLSGNYEISSTKDTSAPGKDSDFSKRDIDEVLYEDLNNANCLYASIYEYPMPIPYERGKIIYYDNKFLDLETLRILYEHPKSKTFRVKSEVVNGWCDIIDEKYYRCLLVEVQKGKIVDYKDVTNVQSLFMNDSFLCERKIEEENLKFLNTILLDSITSDLQSLISKFLKDPFSDLTAYPLFFQWLHFLKQINSAYENKYNKTWNIKVPPAGFYDVLEINFHNDIYIIRAAEQENIGKTFIYDESGQRLNDEPYYRLKVINDSKHLYGKLVLRMSHYNYNKTSGFLIIDSNNKLKEYHYYPFFKDINMCHTLVSNNIEAEDIDIHYQKEYYDIKLNRKKVTYIESIDIETIIEHYCYKTQEGDRQYFPNCLFYNVVGRSHQDGKILFPTDNCIRIAKEYIKKEFEKGNHYVSRIHPLDNFYNAKSESCFYLFEYQPYGKMNMKGEFLYDIDSTIIKL